MHTVTAILFQSTKPALSTSRLIKMATYKRTTVMLDEDVYTEARQLCLDHHIQGGVSALLRGGLEAELLALRKLPLRFDAVFRRALGHTPGRRERLACYGGQRLEEGLSIPATQLHFTLTELVQHHDQGRWDARTAVLIGAQEAHWRSVSKPYWQAPIRPPGWTPAYEAPPVEQAFEPLE
jgi:hypothetical protein